MTLKDEDVIYVIVRDKQFALMVRLFQNPNDTSQMVLGGIAEEEPMADGSVYDFAHGDMMLILDDYKRICPIYNIAHPEASLLERAMVKYGNSQNKRIFAFAFTLEDLNQIANAQSVCLKMTCSRGLAESEANDLIGLAKQLISDMEDADNGTEDTDNGMEVITEPLYDSIDSMYDIMAQGNSLSLSGEQVEWGDDFGEERGDRVIFFMNLCRWQDFVLRPTGQIDKNKHYGFTKEYFISCECLCDKYALWYEGRLFDYRNEKFRLILNGGSIEIIPYKVAVLYRSVQNGEEMVVNVGYYITEEQVELLATSQSVRIQLTCCGGESVGGIADELIKKASTMLYGSQEEEDKKIEEQVEQEKEEKNKKWSIVCAILLIGVPLLWYLLHCLISNY